jgi:hypothetical protein
MDFIAKEKLYVGIDGGKNGAIVGVDQNENIRYYSVMPLDHEGEYDILEIHKMFETLNNIYDLHVGLEKAYMHPLNGCKANFCNGGQYKIMITILSVLKIPFEIIGCKTWQKVIFQGQTVKDTKDASISYCLKKYPEFSLKRTPKCTKNHDGLADAVCLALFLKRNHA